jgi:hypothetical protein
MTVLPVTLCLGLERKQTLIDDDREIQKLLASQRQPPCPAMDPNNTRAGFCRILVDQQNGQAEQYIEQALE